MFPAAACSTCTAELQMANGKRQPREASRADYGEAPNRAAHWPGSRASSDGCWSPTAAPAP
ncbi:hypothetical protein XarCFBP6771_13080 [Xanthomonas arboricola]|nr:hypothetical protein XarCFBP6771_13080 [Xanthomonas arboricola]PPT67733.1 hypothetical protein XarbCFBP8150_15650 [Xanthomonas arboricola]